MGEERGHDAARPLLLVAGCSRYESAAQIPRVERDRYRTSTASPPTSRSAISLVTDASQAGIARAAGSGRHACVGGPASQPHQLASRGDRGLRRLHAGARRPATARTARSGRRIPTFPSARSATGSSGTSPTTTSTGPISPTCATTCASPAPAGGRSRPRIRAPRWSWRASPTDPGGPSRTSTGRAARASSTSSRSIPTRCEVRNVLRHRAPRAAGAARGRGTASDRCG